MGIGTHPYCPLDGNDTGRPSRRQRRRHIPIIIFIRGLFLFRGWAVSLHREEGVEGLTGSECREKLKKSHRWSA